MGDILRRRCSECLRCAPNTISIAVWLAGAAWLAGCGRQPPHPSASAQLPTIPVRVAAITVKPYPAYEETVGTVQAKLRASLAAQISGRIEVMPVTFGQSVKAGDLIARLEARELQARLEQARALRIQAETEFKRAQNLLPAKAMTREQYDATLARYRVAVAGAIEAETMLGYTRIAAPFDGVIARKVADVGDLATPGRSLVELEDPAALRLEAEVPEALIERVQLGATMMVRVSGVTNRLKGVVTEIAPSANPNSRTFVVKLDLPAARGLRSGRFGRVAVPVGETTLPRVPVSAVVVRGEMELVFVVADQKAHLRLVKTGKRYDGQIQLLSGVTPGEQVVVEGAARLVDGQPVHVESAL